MEELGLPYKLEFKRGDLAGSMASIRAINPGMPVAPTVVYGDQVLTESGAIIELILQRHAPGKLAPALDSPDYPAYLSGCTTPKARSPAAPSPIIACG